VEVTTGQPPLYPNGCGVLPFPHINSDPNMRYVDTGVDFIQGGQIERLYVSEPAVKELSRVLGHPTNSEHIRVVAENVALKDELERVTEERDQLRQEINAIDYLGSKDFIARRKVGRPKSTTAKAA